MLNHSLPHVSGTLPGKITADWLRRCGAALPEAIASDYPVVIRRGIGAMLEDMDGNIFLDWTGGVGVLNVGHCHSEVIKAVQDQIGQYFHSMMSVIPHPAYIQLIEKLNALVPVRGTVKKTMLVNNGAEAIENAVKIAKAYTKRPNLIVFSGAYHGRTSLTMAMTAKKAYSLGMGPFPDGVYRVEYPNLYRKPYSMSDSEAIHYYLEQIRRVFQEGTPPEYTAAVVLEPIQGEGGFVPAPIEWVQAVRRMCDEHGILLIADEVQSGFARSGRLFISNYWEEAGCAPDLLACAKSIAGGLPLGAVTACEAVMDAVPHGVIGGTFCGNAVACAAALKVLDIIERDHLAERAVEISQTVIQAMQDLQCRYPEVGDVRGYGAMLGVEFVHEAQSKRPNPRLIDKIIAKCLQNGLIVMRSGISGNVIRFLCPLVVTDEQLEAGLKIFSAAIVKSIEEQSNGC